jgi:hypothetical protein
MVMLARKSNRIALWPGLLAEMLPAKCIFSSFANFFSEKHEVKHTFFRMTLTLIQMFSIRSFTDRILPALRLLVHQQRTVVSKSTRNKGTVWIGAHKDPLTPEQHQRMRRKHKPFVLGRDNVKRNFEPIRLTDASLAITKGIT